MPLTTKIQDFNIACETTSSVTPPARAKKNNY